MYQALDLCQSEFLYTPSFAVSKDGATAAYNEQSNIIFQILISSTRTGIILNHI